MPSSYAPALGAGLVRPPLVEMGWEVPILGENGALESVVFLLIQVTFWLTGSVNLRYSVRSSPCFRGNLIFENRIGCETELERVP